MTIFRFERGLVWLQRATLPEARDNLREAVQLILSLDNSTTGRSRSTRDEGLQKGYRLDQVVQNPIRL